MAAASMGCKGWVQRGGLKRLAEREGFEPPMRSPPCRISSAVHSTTLPPLRRSRFGQSGSPLNVAAFRHKRDFEPFILINGPRAGRVSHSGVARIHCASCSGGWRALFGRLANVCRQAVDTGAGMAYPARNLRHRSVLWGSLFHQPVQTG